MAIRTIGIDIREANTKGTGKSRYALEITKALIKVAPKDMHFVLFTKSRNENFLASKQVKQVQISGKGFFWHFKLRRHLKTHPVDFFLAPTSFIYPAIAPKSQKLAIVVHDLIAFLFPKTHHWFPTLVEKLTLSRAIKRSKFIITVSENTAKDLRRIKPKSKKKQITVAYPATDLKPKNSKSLDLPKKYLLSLGTLLPRKNVPTIIKAFEHIADKEKDLHLVIAGGKGWKTSKIFKSVPPALKNRVKFLGFVQSEKLPELYSRAQMLIFPSLYEGFGIPPLEAMACDCPVITSSTSSLPEVVGDAAIKVNPKNYKALADAILTLLRPQTRETYKKRGHKRAAQFSWEKSARKILELV